MSPPVATQDVVAFEERRSERLMIAKANKIANDRFERDRALNPDKYDMRKALDGYKNSILAKMQIDGRPLGNVTPKEAIEWMDSQQQTTDFLSELLVGVDARDKRPIKEIVDPRTANRLWRQTGGKVSHNAA